MHDRYQATRSLIELCARWRLLFPNQWHHAPRNDGSTDRDLAESIGHHLGSYPWPVGRIPNISRQEWVRLRDTGVRDTLDHATEVVTEHGFEQVAEHSIDTDRYGLRALRLFLYDGLLAQLEASSYDGEWTVSDFQIWGCARITDWNLFDALTMATHSPLRSDQPLPPGERRVLLNIGTSGGSFGLGWLAAAAAVDEWLTPWPEPAVRTWLGPREPSPTPSLDLDQAQRAGRRNTAALLELLPDRVHTRLGTIATHA